MAVACGRRIQGETGVVERDEPPYTYRSPADHAAGEPHGRQVTKTDAEWRAQLTPEEYKVARQKGTESAFTGEYWRSTIRNVPLPRCGAPLLIPDRSTGTAGPVTSRSTRRTKMQDDSSHGMRRTEVVWVRAHLGHRFEDGLAPTGQRYCMNSCSPARAQEVLTRGRTFAPASSQCACCSPKTTR
jgi:peptide-methionine (R)-S-oxide reductase